MNKLERVVQFWALASNLQRQINVSYVFPIWIKDLYNVLTWIIPLHVGELQCPVADEKLCPVLIFILCCQLSFPQIEHIPFEGKQLPTPKLMVGGIGHHLDIHTSFQWEWAQRCIVHVDCACLHCTWNES